MQAAMGPFYCPGDEKLYIDLAFFRDLQARFKAPGDFGDDRMQKQTQGRVVPESFTHGSSEQRLRWFKRGMDTGQPQQCDTFSTGAL